MKNASRKQKNAQNHNLLTANVGHPAIAKQIIEGILIDSGYSETTLDSLTMLFEAFASQKDTLEVRDFADELQNYVFVRTVECDKAVRDYVKSIKAGKDYKTEHLHLVAG